MKILFIFIDGLGIGKFDPGTNPCADKRLRIFNNFCDRPREQKIPLNGGVKAIDPTLGLPGLPQSATGQTALLTGINAAEILKKHLSGFPNSTLRDTLEHHSLLQQFTLRDKKAAFINAYRPIFFKLGPHALIRFLSVTSIANWKAGLKFFSLNDLRAEQCIYHDFTNAELIKKGFKVPLFSAEKAGEILAKASIRFDFCLYEYFKTDKAGHAQDIEKAVALLLQLEHFIMTIVNRLDLEYHCILVTSDHGNIEDLSVRTHTQNPVPLIVWGHGKDELLNLANSIVDIAPALVQLSLQHLSCE